MCVCVLFMGFVLVGMSGLELVQRERKSARALSLQLPQAGRDRGYVPVDLKGLIPISRG